MVVHFQEGLKMQCKQMWTFLEVFSMVTGSIFSKIYRLNRTLLCH